MTISIIVAIARNGAIGKDNKLLWHISEDLRYFKRVTSGNPVVMGRKTWESIGKPLPGRRNIIISHSLDSIPGAEVFRSVESALEEVEKSGADEIFIIGGGEIYRQALPFVNKLYLTKVQVTIADADTFFPPVDYTEWQELSRESFERGEKFEYPFEFVVLERK